MIPIKYIEGDATAPQDNGSLNIIAHVCNDQGGWGAGFVMALSDRDLKPERTYRAWHNNPQPGRWHRAEFALGNIEIVPFMGTTFVCNMLAQRGFYGDTHDNIPLSYTALAQCLSKLGLAATRFVGSHVHMPRIGCGLAGGTWDRVEPLVEQFLSRRDIPVTVYDLPVYGMVDSGGLVEQAKRRKECRHDQNHICCLCAGGQGYKPPQQNS